MTLLTFSFHTLRQTLGVSTVLTAVSLSLIDNTVAIVAACVAQIFTNGAFKESLTTFTATEVKPK